MSLSLIIQYLFSGITSGSIYAIVAIGFNIIYNTTGIINFAQGEFVMLGGMTAITLLRLHAAACRDCLRRGDNRARRRRSSSSCSSGWLKNPTVIQMIIVTIGLSILIREAALHIWDEKVHSLPYFTGNEISSIRLFGAYISPAGALGARNLRRRSWSASACFSRTP